jgi:hypothetical protein
MTTIADQLHTATPHISAYRSEPFSIADIDAHPDAGRIWATIKAMQAKAERDAEDEGDSIQEQIRDAEESAEDKGRDEGREDAIADVDDNIRALLREYKGDLSEGLEKAILTLTEGL